MELARIESNRRSWNQVTNYCFVALDCIPEKYVDERADDRGEEKDEGKPAWYAQARERESDNVEIQHSRKEWQQEGMV